MEDLPLVFIGQPVHSGNDRDEIVGGLARLRVNRPARAWRFNAETRLANASLLDGRRQKRVIVGAGVEEKIIPEVSLGEMVIARDEPVERPAAMAGDNPESRVPVKDIAVGQ